MTVVEDSPFSSCRVCGSPDIVESFRFHEFMFGRGDPFDYGLCGACGCLQIKDLPANIGKFYPSAYYSLQSKAPSISERMIQMTKDAMRVLGPPRLFAGQEWFEYGEYRAIRDAKLRHTDHILDLGCGSGALIASLNAIGFANVEGADPFVEPGFTTWNGVHIQNKTAAEVVGQYDVVMMHHSLEHIWDQQEIASDAWRLLKPGGKLIVRIPTSDSWAFGHYGSYWIQLDPPRHFYLHSRRSIRLLLEAHGFEIQEIVDDSSSFQIVGSEIIKAQGIPIIAEIRRNPAAWMRAAELNAAGRGDSLAIHAKRPT